MEILCAIQERGSVKPFRRLWSHLIDELGDHSERCHIQKVRADKPAGHRFNPQEEEQKANRAILKCKRQEAAGFKLIPI